MTLLDMIHANAELAVKIVRKQRGVELTFDRNGVKWIEGYLHQLRSHFPYGDWEADVNVMGAFLGECFLRSYGGRWVEQSGRAWLMEIRQNPTVFIDVFGQV